MSSLSFPFLVAALSWNNFSSFVHAQQEYATFWMTLWALCILSYLSNPTPISFRTHLTSLSFHSHLRRLHNPSATEKEGSASLTHQQADIKDECAHASSFTSRIHLSLKTPAYHLKSYGLFTLVVMPAPTRKRSQTSSKSTHAPEGFLRTLPDQPAIWVGFLGRWWALTGESSYAEEEKECLARLSNGIHELTVPSGDEAENLHVASVASVADESFEKATASATQNSAQQATTGTAAAARATRNAKRVFKAGQRRSSPTSISRLRNKASTTSTSQQPPADGSDEPFRSADDPKAPYHSTTSSHDLVVNEIDANLEAAASSTDPVIVELRTQVDELRSSTVDNEHRLQEELDLLRRRKKDEDQSRADLKAKTRELEDQKRDVELSKNEAERELGERRAVLKERSERVAKLRKEIQAIERKEQEMVDKREKKKRDRKEREKKLREDVGKKREELRQVQSSVEKTIAKVTALEQTLAARRELLVARRNDFANRSIAMSGSYMPAMYPRHNGSSLYVPYSNASRPGSVRSLEPPFTSAPSSPVLTHQPLRDDGFGLDKLPSLPSGALALNGYRAPPHEGFFEHRLHHAAASTGAELPPSSSTFLSGGLPSVDDIPAQFLPFEDDKSLALDGQDDQHGYKKLALSLPLQYLDSGLLAGGESPATEAPLSPMTPSQTSLIPSQLFHMLDDDDAEGEDDFIPPDSPTLSRSIDAGHGDRGLGLDASDLGTSPRSLPKLSQPGPLSPPLLSPVSDHSSASGRTATDGPHSPWELSNDPLARVSGGLKGHAAAALTINTRTSNGPDDNLPRSGLSLNPDAKAFAFEPRSSPSPTVASAKPVHAIAPTSSSMPTIAATVSDDIGIPRKSRMDFAQHATTGSTGSLTTTVPVVSEAIRSSPSFEWSRPSPPLANRSSPANAATSTMATTPKTSLFDPFGADDELLGPLRKT